jgi:hypothetical protein
VNEEVIDLFHEELPISGGGKVKKTELKDDIENKLRDEGVID